MVETEFCFSQWGNPPKPKLAQWLCIKCFKRLPRNEKAMPEPTVEQVFSPDPIAFRVFQTSHDCKKCGAVKTVTQMFTSTFNGYCCNGCGSPVERSALFAASGSERREIDWDKS